MPRKKKSLSDFDTQVKDALEHYSDTEWLGATSPLAMPYFLGALLTALESGGETAVNRGQILQQVMVHSLEAMWGEPMPDDQQQLQELVDDERDQKGKGNRYYALLLELRYVRRFFQLPKLRLIWEDVLFVSKPQFHRDLETAVTRFSEQLLHQVRPALRLEQPALRAPLIGQTPLQQACLEALVQGQTVAISGVGGMGKTSLGTAIMEAWATRTVFWYTIYPSMNDKLSSLLFALGYFLKAAGASSLWLQLVADEGKVEDINLALGLVRHDLETLADKRPLLCFDEVDQLYAPEPEMRDSGHTQILTFIENLRPHVPLLLIGQRAVIEADAYHTLHGLSLSHIGDLCAQRGVSNISPYELNQLHRYTDGNPRLLMLFIALYRSGETVSELLKALPKTPAMQPVFDRLWQRLSVEERALLQMLSIFRGEAPLDVWQSQQALLTALIERQLVKEDRFGGVALLPALRTMIYAELPVEQREQLHMVAASIRASHGEYTAATYHYWQAGEAETAVYFWHTHYRQEVNRGQAETALELFETISLRHLPDEAKQTLILIRSHLYQLTGESNKGLDAIQSIEWPTDSVKTVDVLRYWGWFLQTQGHVEHALDKYEAGVEQAERRLELKRALLRTQRGMIYVQHLRDMSAAWAEAQLIRYEAETMQGVVQGHLGYYKEARHHYEAALNIAEKVEAYARIAEAHVNLGMVAAQSEDMPTAVYHYQEALTYYQQAGNKFKAEALRINLAAMYIQAEQYENAVELMTSALTFFERIKNPYWHSLAAANLAEGYFGLGEIEKAQQYAQVVLQQEEPISYPYGLLTLGNVKRAQGEYPLAERFLLDAKKVAAQGEDKFVTAYIWQALGELYQEGEAWQKSYDALQETLTLFTQLNIEKEVAATEALLAEVVDKL